MSNTNSIEAFNIDLGASGNRCATNNGKIFTFPNNMVMLNTMDTTKLRVETDLIDDNIECKIIKTEGDNSASFFPTNVLVGSMADKHRIASERPSVNLSKHKQKINYISAIVACAINRIEYGGAENFELNIAVPPIEVYDAEEAFSKYLSGRYEVEFPKYKGGIKTTINIVKVACYEEALMALTSFLFNMNLTIKEENRQFQSKTIMSLDIGASTSDVAIKDAKKGYLDKSGRTWKIGGRMVLDSVMDMVSQKYNIELSFENAEIAVSEGRIQQGAQYIDISDIIMTAKYEFARTLVEHMQTYFKSIDVDINSIYGIMVSGGGSLQSQYVNEDKEVVKTSEPMSYYVTQELKKIAPGILVVSYGDEPRFANVKGLFIKDKFERMKRATLTKTETSNVIEVRSAAPTVITDTNKDNKVAI